MAQCLVVVLVRACKGGAVPPRAPGIDVALVAEGRRVEGAGAGNHHLQRLAAQRQHLRECRQLRWAERRNPALVAYRYASGYEQSLIV